MAIANPVQNFLCQIHFLTTDHFLLPPILSCTTESYIVNNWIRTTLPAGMLTDQFAFRSSDYSTTCASVKRQNLMYIDFSKWLTLLIGEFY